MCVCVQCWCLFCSVPRVCVRARALNIFTFEAAQCHVLWENDSRQHFYTGFTCFVEREIECRILSSAILSALMCSHSPNELSVFYLLGYTAGLMCGMIDKPQIKRPTSTFSRAFICTATVVFIVIVAIVITLYCLQGNKSGVFTVSCVSVCLCMGVFGRSACLLGATRSIVGCDAYR